MTSGSRPARQVVFPSGEPVGELSLVVEPDDSASGDADGPVIFGLFPLLLQRGGAERWRDLGPATGTVKVDPNADLYLKARRAEIDRLPGVLAALNANDLQGLNVLGIPLPPTFAAGSQRLVHLGLVGCRPDGKQLAALSTITSLRILLLGQCGRVETAHVACFAGLPRLRVLSFGGEVQAGGLDPLAGCVHLESVVLQHSTLGTRELVAVTGIPNLRELILAGSSVPADGLVRLADCRRLEYLNLAGCPADDTTLARLGGHPSLKSLQLGSCPVTDAGIDSLELPALRLINLENCDVSDVAIDRLRSRVGDQLVVNR